MTTIERPYWPHSNPEPPEALTASECGWVASPLSECLNGCESRTGDATSKVLCEPDQRLCTSCRKRLDKWLRALPESFGLLLWVKDHGTVPSDPGTKHTKRPDPPAPMRLEVIDLLDTRSERGVLGIVHSWAELVRDERQLERRCACGHLLAAHPEGHCNRCDCQTYITQPTVASECSLILGHLAYATGCDWAGDLYDEIRVLARTLQDTVGEYRPKPVGKCAALREVPGATLQDVCGGALVMVKPDPEDPDQRTSVKCLTCGARHEANHELRALGLLVDRIFNPGQDAS